MSWFDNLVPKRIQKRDKTDKPSVPEGLWTKCKKCDTALYEAELAKSLGVCRKCGNHHYLSPDFRAKIMFDEDSEIIELGKNIRPRDFLKFTDEQTYKERIKKYSSKEDPARESLRVFQGKLAKRNAVIACFDWSFMGGSLGSVAGERFVRGVDTACDRGAPFIVFSSSGGARMQEGLVALLQMAKTTAAQAKLASLSLPFISVLCNPTTGGVAASFALAGDIIIAEPDATIGFAGERVIKQTVREDLPEGFQRSEFLLEHGSIDMVVDRRDMRETIVQLCEVLLDGRNSAE